MKISEFVTKEEEYQSIMSDYRYGFISTQEMLDLMDAHVISGKRLIREDLDPRLVKVIKQMKDNYGTDNPILGNKYIPVQIAMFNKNITITDILNNSNLQAPAEFLTLQKINGTEYVMVTDQGRKLTYPNNAIGKFAYFDTIMIEHEKQYNALQIHVSYEFHKWLPDLK
jgi:hypothetical protein